MVRIVPVGRGGADYVATYLERMGDSWAAALAPKVRHGGRFTVAGPEGAGESELGDLENQTGGFGVGYDLSGFQESFVRRFLAEDAAHYALFELAWDKTETAASFPVFRFQPSQLATWDGAVWTPWREGHCAFVSGANGDAALHDALAECLWARGVIALLAVPEAALGLLRGGGPDDLARLADLVETVIVPAHDGEAYAMWNAR